METKCREAKVKVKIKDIRGNVDTRIKKFKRGDYDGACTLQRRNSGIAVYVGAAAEEYTLERVVLSKDRCLEEARAFIEGLEKVCNYLTTDK